MTKKIDSLRPDNRNANKHTQRGMGLLEKSLRNYGAGRSILCDKNGNVIAGNATLEAAASIGIEDIQYVDSDGTKLVVVRRTDLHIDSKEARELAIADNRVGQVNLDWDAAVLQELMNEGAGLDTFFRENELEDLQTLAMIESELNNNVGLTNSIKESKFKPVKIVLSVEDVSIFETAMKMANESLRGDSFITICEEYIKNHAERQ